MRKLILALFTQSIAHASKFQCLAEGDSLKSNAVLPKDCETTANIRKFINVLIDHCGLIEFRKGAHQLEALDSKVKDGSLTLTALAFELERFLKDITWELQSHVFLHITNECLPGREIWDEICENCGEAFHDIDSAEMCISVEQYTAGVFHLMRVSEFGLRRIARKLKVSIKHKGKTSPLEYGEWDKVITACKNKITAARGLPMGPRRAAALEKYSDAADHCSYMKDIWRNDVSHTRTLYSEREALLVSDRVRDFMRSLINL